MKVELYTDGAAKGNPGPGGFGVVLKAGSHYKELSGGFRKTTNNRMELLAVVEGLRALNPVVKKVDLYSDSKYVLDSLKNGWVYNWRRKGYKGKKNKDLWEALLNEYKKYEMNLYWVKGHSGHKENERCDTLAVKAAEGKNLMIDEFYENFQDESNASKDELF